MSLRRRAAAGSRRGRPGRRVVHPVLVAACPESTSTGWQPLPHDVAEWMGLDQDMLPFVLDLAGVRPQPA